MAPKTKKERDQEFDRFAALLQNSIDQLSPDLIQDPKLGEVLLETLTGQLNALLEAQAQEKAPPDQGLAQLIGIGPDAAEDMADVRAPEGVMPYDETVTSERLLALGDLYYIYQHEKIGVFRATLKLQELFKAGAVKLSSGPGAYKLYRYDRRKALRFTQKDRMQAYLRAFGYSRVAPAPGARPNRDFHKLFLHFNSQVARFFRDKRISEVIRTRATDPSFGSIAIVRRAGHDMRHNLKEFSYGHLNVLRVELLQLLEEAFQILGADDVKRLFGSDTAWDVIEEVYRRYFKQSINVSARNRMAIAGREIFRWLAQPHILNATRAEFEALLLQIADDAEEWLTSAEALGITRPGERMTAFRNGRAVPSRAWEAEWEFEY
jgi:hypothetical protein